MTTRIQDLNSFSNSPIFELNNPIEISKHLSSIVDAYPFYDDLIFADIKGEIISSSKRGKIGKNLFVLEKDLKDEFIKTVDGGSNDVFVSDLSDTNENTNTNENTLDLEILSDIRNSSGKTIGVLIGIVNIELIKELVHDIDDRTIGTEYAYLVDDPGNILFTADPKATILAPHPDLNIKNLKSKLEGDENGFLIYVNSKGRKVISGYADLKEYGAEKVGDWSLLSTAPYNDIMAPLYNLFFNISMFLLLTMAATLFIGFFIARTISLPIVKLKNAAIRIGKGEFVTKIGIESKDEIGVLSKTLVDMSASLKERSDEIIYAKELAQKGEKIKAEFLANMSHEIRTPMNGVLGMLGILEETELTTEQQDTVKTIRSCGDSLMVILNDVLDFSKMDADKLELEYIPFNLKKCLEDSIFLFAKQASEKGITLTFNIDENIPEGFTGDVTRIRQVLVNLINNALKFTSQGEIIVSVTSSFNDDDLYDLQFSIKDSGIGISKEDRNKLFKTFSQVDSSTTRKFGGTGLGLAISYKLIKRMDGKIWVESKLGEGSTFSFNISLKSTKLNEKEAQSNKFKIDSNLAKKFPMRILLVEDNSINQELAVNMLQSVGYQANVAGNGQEAIDLLEQIDYDLILMDLQMPVLDGVKATKIIVEKWGECRPRIVAMTANVLPEHRKMCKDAGMDGFIPKPISIEDLVKTILNSYNEHETISKMSKSVST